MRSFLLSCLILLSLISRAQKIKTLTEVAHTDSIQNDHAIIYGNFIQRLGFTSGGFPQDIRIEEINTKEIFSFRVKPTFKSAKENIFCFFISPGTYALLNYWYTESKWYGGKEFTEQVLSLEHRRFVFTVKEHSISYLGNWNFSRQEVSFINDKSRCDIKLKSIFHNINFESATTTLPVVAKSL